MGVAEGAVEGTYASFELIPTFETSSPASGLTLPLEQASKEYLETALNGAEEILDSADHEVEQNPTLHWGKSTNNDSRQTGKTENLVCHLPCVRLDFSSGRIFRISNSTYSVILCLEHYLRSNGISARHTASAIPCKGGKKGDGETCKIARQQVLIARILFIGSDAAFKYGDTEGHRLNATENSAILMAVARCRDGKRNGCIPLLLAAGSLSIITRKQTHQIQLCVPSVDSYRHLHHSMMAENSKVRSLAWRWCGCGYGGTHSFKEVMSMKRIENFSPIPLVGLSAKKISSISASSSLSPFPANFDFYTRKPSNSATPKVSITISADAHRRTLYLENKVGSHNSAAMDPTLLNPYGGDDFSFFSAAMESDSPDLSLSLGLASQNEFDDDDFAPFTTATVPALQPSFGDVAIDQASHLSSSTTSNLQSSFGDFQIDQMAKALQYGLVSDRSSKQYYQGLHQFADSMIPRMHHKGLINRVSKFISTFSLDPNQTGKIPQDCILQKLHTKYGNMRDELRQTHDKLQQDRVDFDARLEKAASENSKLREQMARTRPVFENLRQHASRMLQQLQEGIRNVSAERDHYRNQIDAERRQNAVQITRLSQELFNTKSVIEWQKAEMQQLREQSSALARFAHRQAPGPLSTAAVISNYGCELNTPQYQGTNKPDIVAQVSQSLAAVGQAGGSVTTNGQIVTQQNQVLQSPQQGPYIDLTSDECIDSSTQHSSSQPIISSPSTVTPPSSRKVEPLTAAGHGGLRRELPAWVNDENQARVMAMCGPKPGVDPRKMFWNHPPSLPNVAHGTKRDNTHLGLVAPEISKPAKKAKTVAPKTAKPKQPKAVKPRMPRERKNPRPSKKARMEAQNSGESAAEKQTGHFLPGYLKSVDPKSQGYFASSQKSQDSQIVQQKDALAAQTHDGEDNGGIGWDANTTDGDSDEVLAHALEELYENDRPTESDEQTGATNNSDAGNSPNELAEMEATLASKIQVFLQGEDEAEAGGIADNNIDYLFDEESSELSEEQ